jgi:beta-glucosidase/6-phospho-beta-glucosidase/beta-galactosidase
MKPLSLLAFWMSIPFAMAALPPVEIQSYKLFESGTGEEVVVKGIDYYPRPNAGDLNVNSMDLFTEKHRATWERDIPFLQELGVNAVRLYAVTASENHDAFMCAMEAAGIYVIVALAHDCPTCAVTRDQAPDCYPPELKLQGQAVIHAFSKYANTLAFSAGNEVNHFAPADQPAWNAPCQKKFIRDMRAYIASCPALRKVPVGLVSADSERDKLAKYYKYVV